MLGATFDSPFVITHKAEVVAEESFGCTKITQIIFTTVLLLPLIYALYALAPEIGRIES